MNETIKLDLSQFEKPNKDTPNVKDLWRPKVEQENEDEIPFDPERDITERDWEKMYKEQTNQFETFQQSMCMKIIDPKKDLRIQKNSWSYEELPRSLNRNRDNNNWVVFAEQATWIKILNMKIDLKITKKAWEGMINQLEKYRNDNLWGDFSTHAMHMKIIDPKKDLGLNETDWQNMSDRLEKYRNDNLSRQVFASFAMKMKILDPSRVKLTKTDWQYMTSELEENRNNNQGRWENFSWQAMAMKILAAEKVEITDQGLKLTMPEKKLSIAKIPPLPTRLNLN